MLEHYPSLIFKNLMIILLLWQYLNNYMYNIIIIESNSMKAVLITKETFRFNDEDNYVCKIFSVLSSAHALVETSCQMLENL